MSQLQVRYIGKQEEYKDSLYGSDIVWQGSSDVQLVPEEVATTMAKEHPDIFELVSAEKDTEEDAGIEEEDLEGEDTSESNERINEPFDPMSIKIETKSLVIDLIVTRIKQKEIDLNPDFQRHSGVWDKKRQSQLIESFLLRIPIPVFYMAADKEDKWQVVDGLQRLDTLKNFIIDKKLRLQGLEYLKNFEGFSCDELPRPMRRRIDETQLSCHIIQPGTPPEVMYNVFKRINTGGKPLLPQEIRHALNPGIAREFINKLATDDAFLDATNHSVDSTRMADRECVLRFIAFYLQPFDKYKGDLDTFLVKAMQSLNKDMSPEKLDSLHNDFCCAMRAAASLFGTWAFRKPLPGRTNPVNKPLFEAWSVNLARLEGHQHQRLIERKEAVKVKFDSLMKDEEFEKSISIGTQWKAKVNIRFSRIKELLDDVLA